MVVFLEVQVYQQCLVYSECSFRCIWLIHLSPRCSGVRPPLPQVGQLLSPNPWQSKHFHLSKMLPFFLFLPVPLHPGHSTAPFPLHVLQAAATVTLPLRAPRPDAVVLQPRRSPAALVGLINATAAPVLHLKPVTKLLLVVVAMATCIKR